MPQGHAICEYGSLPGMMVKSSTAPFSLMWTLFDKKCQIKDELTRVLGPPPWTLVASKDPRQVYEFWAKDARTPLVSNIGPQVKSTWEQPPQWVKPGETIRMLYFGDSVDAAQILDVCKEAQFRNIQTLMGGFGRNCPACHIATGLKIVEEFIPGNWPHGPYLDGYTDADSPAVNIPKGFQHLLQSTGDIKPTIVVFNALLWDLGRLHQHNRSEHMQQHLTKAFVNEHMRLLGSWLTMIERSVPADALLVYHNAAFPRLKDCRTNTENAHEPLGHQIHIMQLNQAGKHVLRNRTRWHLVDYGQMSEATMLDFAHLRDGLHPNQQFMMQGLNIILNLYREHKLESARPGG